ncbi:uncharacterized protein BYT42DRAFT_572178 [Radiomyces spectabilis]|uniref:uncharacterized protein n=1 Tax=Radiomyces spectabilis TaxID=64574 RepID=UPI00221F1B09|nr:uncharacterized protein BYT42DRAFT_572178 [Radiomyces spectabilis]KAI8377914.1 hypothetical protein BYT42DRAFT_572178 [Radiomyces spectabilis]
MEINKDEAIRCLSIAKNHYGNGNYTAALKFTKKSLGLYPTDDAKAFLEKAEKAAASASQETTGTSTGINTTSSQTKPEKRAEEKTKKHTPEQAAAVKAILSCGTDYYKVLSLDKKCTEVQVKKAYRKLALQFHPDKNSAPGADEAFKLISKAFTVLSDPQKRAIHDAGGGDPEQRASGASSFSRSYQQAGFAGEDISPEDLFNMFFGGGPFGASPAFGGPRFRTHTFHMGGAGRRHPFFAQQRAAPASQMSGWIQLLPLLVLFAYALISALLSPEQAAPYSFKHTSVYSKQRTTLAHHIPYFVNPSSFQATEQHRYKLARLEQDIENEWVSAYRRACQLEHRDRSTELSKARGLFGIGRDDNRYQEVLNTPMRSCEELKKHGFRPDYFY